MNKILDTKLCEILESKIFNHADSQAAIEEFTSRLYCLCKADADYASLYRTLTCTRIQIEQISDALRSKKNVSDSLRRRYAETTLRLIDAELHLLHIRVEHPELFSAKTRGVLLHWQGSINDLVEIISALFYSKVIVDEGGVPLSFLKLVNSVETLFGVSISRPYDKRGRLEMRKKSVTPFLDKLKTLVIKNTTTDNQ